MEIQEIQQFLNDNMDNEGVKALINSFRKEPSLDDFKTLAETDNNFKSYFDSEKDKHANKVIETFKQNNLNKLVEAELLKRNPKLTPEQIEMENIRKELDTMKKEKARAEMTSKYKDVLNEKKIPSNLTNFLLSDDDDTTTANITLFEESMKNYIDSMVEERLKQNSYTPPKGDNGNMNNMDKLSPLDKMRNAYNTKK